jgi:hypothetical protein
MDPDAEAPNQTVVKMEEDTGNTEPDQIKQEPEATEAPSNEPVKSEADSVAGTAPDAQIKQEAVSMDAQAPVEGVKSESFGAAEGGEGPVHSGMEWAEEEQWVPQATPEPSLSRESEHSMLSHVISWAQYYRKCLPSVSYTRSSACPRCPRGNLASLDVFCRIRKRLPHLVPK